MFEQPTEEEKPKMARRKIKKAKPTEEMLALQAMIKPGAVGNPEAKPPKPTEIKESGDTDADFDPFKAAEKADKNSSDPFARA